MKAAGNRMCLKTVSGLESPSRRLFFLVFAAGLLLSGQQLFADPDLKNGSFEDSADQMVAAPYLYTKPRGPLDKIPNWTFCNSQGGTQTGSYSGLIRAGSVAGGGSGGLESPSPYPDGKYAAFIEVLGSIYQDVDGFEAGKSYVIVFQAAGRLGNKNGGAGDGTQHLTVKIDDTVLTFDHQDSVGPPDRVWAKFTSDPFISTGTTHRITFQGTLEGDYTSFIDAVSIDEVQ